MANEQGEGEDLVMVPVPRRHLAAVYGVIADREGSVGPRNGAARPAATPEWSEDLVKRAYRESSPNMQKVLKYLAKRPEQQVPSGDVAGALHLTAVQLAGVFGAFGRRCFNRYGMGDDHGTAVFPFGHRWDYGVGSVVYVMPEWVAKAIEAL